MPMGFSAGGQGTRCIPGGPERGVEGRHFLAPARSLFLSLPILRQEAGAAGKNYLLHFLYFSCKFASVVERGQRRILTCRHHYLATLVQVQKLATRPNGTGGAGHLRGAKALTA